MTIMFGIVGKVGNNCIETSSSIAYQFFSTMFYLTNIENFGTNLLFYKKKKDPRVLFIWDA